VATEVGTEYCIGLADGLAKGITGLYAQAATQVLSHTGDERVVVGVSCCGQYCSVAPDRVHHAGINPRTRRSHSRIRITLSSVGEKYPLIEILLPRDDQVTRLRTEIAESQRRLSRQL